MSALSKTRVKEYQTLFESDNRSDIQRYVKWLSEKMDFRKLCLREEFLKVDEVVACYEELGFHIAVPL